MMELRHLRSLVMLAREGSFTRAARRLRIAQPALQSLARIKEVRLQRLELQFPQQIVLVPLRQRLEQFRVVVEVILD